MSQVLSHNPRPKAVVFAYHNVGVRCLSVLRDQGVDIALIVSHEDNPNETIWFDSVKAWANTYRIPVITPDTCNTPDTIAHIAAHAPDFIFSFYYRHMICADILAIATRGAYNMHGSLLPKYRGRVPTNWAVLHGEKETGATLHVMNEKPDNGAIVGQMVVPILSDDTAKIAFDKTVFAAEMVLIKQLPLLVSGTATLTPQDLSQGAYFGGRTAKDGEINFDQSVTQIHNLVRAVAPPYPPAHYWQDTHQIFITQTRILSDDECQALRAKAPPLADKTTAFRTPDAMGERYLMQDKHGKMLEILTQHSLVHHHPKENP